MNERLGLLLSLEIFRVGDVAPSLDKNSYNLGVRVLYILQASSWRQGMDYQPHFADKETEAHKGESECLGVIHKQS